jgi:hypothetical protein
LLLGLRRASGGIMLARERLDPPSSGWEKGGHTMTEHQREAPEGTEAERYYAQYASLDVGTGGSVQAALHLQEAINEGAPELEAD